MGNQASRAIDRSRRKDRRRSTATLGARSHTSQGNYNWIEENQATDLSAGALNAALAAASKPPIQLQQPQQQPPRRKSITELFTIRKLSFASTRPSEEDFREYDRLQRQHYLLKSARKSNAWAPIQSPGVIVDVGTGNGIWALEMAAQHPQAKIIGIDIRPPPEQAAGPVNLKYIRADIHEPWPISDHVADFIFQRNMASEVRKDHWPSLLAEMYRVLKPGGYIEFLEADPCFHSPGPVQQAFDGFRRGQWLDANLDFEFAESMDDRLEQAGFAKVEKRVMDIPIGEWPEEPELKQFGFINKETQKAYLRNRKHDLVTKWNIPVADYDTAVQEVLEEFEEQRSFSRFYCWIAQKPEKQEQGSAV